MGYPSCGRDCIDSGGREERGEERKMAASENLDGQIEGGYCFPTQVKRKEATG